MSMFEDDVFINVYTRLITYALSDVFLPVFALILVSLGALTWLLRKEFNYSGQYDFLNYLPAEKSCAFGGMIFFAISIMIYAWVVFSLDSGIFSNHDIMHDHFITGTRQQYGFFSRLNPLVFLDLTIVYGVTHNFILINLYVIGLHLFALYLLYRLLDMLSVTKRFWILGIVTLLPSYFWTCHIVFTERLMLIYVTASLLCLRNYLRHKRTGWIFGYLFWANMAIYTKETDLLFYVGLVIVMIAKRIYTEEITLRSFVHPLQTIKQFPIEFLSGLSILFFVIQHTVIIQGIMTNSYLHANRYGSFSEVFDLYKFEIAIIFVSLFFVFLPRNKNAFLKLIYSANLFSVFYILGYLRLVSIGYTSGRTYYIAVPMVFIVCCWLASIKNIKTFIITVFILCGLSYFQNIKIYEQDVGKSRLEVAKFLADQGEIKVMMGKTFDPRTWYCSCWPIAFKQAYPGRKVVFKSMNCHLFATIPETYQTYSLKITDQPEVGDYYLVLKNDLIDQDIEVLKNFSYREVLQNKFYILYQISDEI